MRNPIILFTAATLIPLPLIGAAAVYGGLWVVFAFGFLTVMTATLDETIKRITPPTPEAEFPAANTLSVVLALGHFVILFSVVSALSGNKLSGWEKIGIFAAAGLFFGQVSNSNAHELIHRAGRPLRNLGKWVYISLLFGHHTSAHVLIHHRYVATADDPNSARTGESFYHFAARAWRGSFRAGYRAEAARLTQINRPAWHNPYVTYIGGAVLMIIAALWIGGLMGVITYISLSAFAQTQLLMSDYVQHYGLSRNIHANGKPVPVAAAHSWNSPHWFSSAMMLNAPRHSDHHAHPGRPYPALTLPDDGPMLPRSLPVMSCIALYPRLWRRVMDARAAKWGTS